MNCPECNKPMTWKESLLYEGGGTNNQVGRYYCSDCRIYMKPIESRAVSKGRELAHNLEGIHAMHPKITKQSCAVQIGILRERQHCKTCDNAAGSPCICKGKCDCLYCRINRGQSKDR